MELTYKHWEHPNAEDGIISDSRGRFRVRKYNDETSLTISNAQESDAGNYRCALSEQNTIIIIENFNLRFQVKKTCSG